MATTTNDPPIYTIMDDNNENVRLLDPNVRNRRKYCKHPNLLGCLGIFLIIVAINVLAVYYVYFRHVQSVKIMALNVWGMPGSLGGRDKEDRIDHIARIINGSDFDVIFLEELWMEPDYYTIRSKIPDGFHITEFRDLALSTCDGRIAPSFCSGLTVISRFPFVEKEFNSYTDHGKASEMFIDGEYFARKGVGRVRFLLGDNVTADFFITHTIADAIPGHHYTNHPIRTKQVEELLHSYVLKSDADLVVLGGDFNSPPNRTETEPYGMIRKYMKNAIEEIYYKFEAWVQPEYATFGNKENTWSRQYDPVIFDYIFHKSKPPTIAWTNIFKLPFFHFTYENGTIVSVSDHEAVTATIYFRKC